ncbi:hypothetical protein [Mesorhizobium sp. CAU 1732]|uniref:hypothetical protein n=1 Tax=Mesorhizobium sp. CAU 1732 TaxID=3140358 RepID=UPI003260A9F6
MRSSFPRHRHLDGAGKSGRAMTWRQLPETSKCYDKASFAQWKSTEIAPDRVAAILVEPVHGGFLPAPDAFMQGLRALADRHGIVNESLAVSGMA